ncbi:MAG: antitoxin [Leptospiraceae bacterium]|nr:antitoxin [Leptospiraceae bacterium]
MNTKLTLNIEQDIIEKAKEYARSKNRSVSNLVEEYLRSLAFVKTKTKKAPILFEPITKELIGMIKVKNPEKINYNDILTKSLLEKYK